MTFRGERGICRHLSDLKLQPCWWQPRWWQPRWWQPCWWQRVRVQDSMAQMHLHMRTESPAQQYPLRRKRKDPNVTSRGWRPSARCVRTTEPRSLDAGLCHLPRRRSTSRATACLSVLSGDTRRRVCVRAHRLSGVTHEQLPPCVYPLDLSQHSSWCICQLFKIGSKTNQPPGTVTSRKT